MNPNLYDLRTQMWDGNDWREVTFPEGNALTSLVALWLEREGEEMTQGMDHETLKRWACLVGNGHTMIKHYYAQFGPVPTDES